MILTPSDTIRVTCSSEIPACSLAVIDSYSKSDHCFTVSKPTADNISPEQLVIVPELVPANAIGIAYKNGVHVVEQTSGETIAAGDYVGTDANAWTAIKGEGFYVVDVDGDYLVIRPVSGGGSSQNWTLMRVASEATGDGLYTCRIYDLDATDWDDEAGTSKIVAASDTDDYTVLNLAEFDPESTYIAHLAAGDIIFATQVTDDESNSRWVGIPLRKDNADRDRVAYCNGAPTGKTISAFLDRDTTGTAITVYTMVAQTAECPNNTVDLDDVQPRLKDGDPIIISKTRYYSSQSSSLVDQWLCKTIFQPTNDCVCVEDTL